MKNIKKIGIIVVVFLVFGHISHAANDWNSTRSNKTSKTTSADVIGVPSTIPKAAVDFESEMGLSLNNLEKDFKCLKVDEVVVDRNYILGQYKKYRNLGYDVQNSIFKTENILEDMKSNPKNSFDQKCLSVQPVKPNVGIQVTGRQLNPNEREKLFKKIDEKYRGLGVEVGTPDMRKRPGRTKYSTLKEVDQEKGNGDKGDSGKPGKTESPDIFMIIMPDSRKDDGSGDKGHNMTTREGGDDPIPGINVIIEKNPSVEPVHFDGTSCADCGNEPIKLSEQTSKILVKALPKIKKEGWQVKLKAVDIKKYPKGTAPETIPVKKVEKKKLLWFIPIEVEMTGEVNENGEVKNINKPWWSFLVR